MKKITILAGVAALGLSGAVIAQAPAGPGGELSRAEALARAEQRFAQLDGDRNGQVTREEMRAGRQERRSERSHRRAERLNSLTPEQRAEREQRRAARGAVTPEQRAERRAQRRAERAQLTPEQRAERRAQRQSRRGNRGGAFAGDGVVTLAEFRQRAAQRFDRLDLDRNGIITRAERVQAGQQMRQSRSRG